VGRVPVRAGDGDDLIERLTAFQHDKCRHQLRDRRDGHRRVVPLREEH
jgi:hypothetical protein